MKSCKEAAKAEESERVTTWLQLLLLPVQKELGLPSRGMCSQALPGGALAHAVTAFTLHPGDSSFIFCLGTITA